MASKTAATAVASPPAAAGQSEADPFDSGTFDVQRYVNSMFPTGGWRAGLQAPQPAREGGGHAVWRRRRRCRSRLPLSLPLTLLLVLLLQRPPWWS